MSADNSVNSDSSLELSTTDKSSGFSAILFGGHATELMASNDEVKASETANNFIQMNYVMTVLIALIQGSLDIVLLAYFYIYFYDHKASPCQLAVF